MATGKPAHFRIIFKMRNNAGLLCHETDDIQIVLQRNHVPWPQWSMLYPGIVVNTLFTSTATAKINELVAMAVAADPTYTAPNFCSYFTITCPSSTDAMALLQSVTQCASVELAYLQNGNYQPPSPHAITVPCTEQGYLEPAPEGINARYARTFTGGEGVKFIDIEQGWGLNHRAIDVQTLPATGFNVYEFQDHGTSVLGIVAMQDKINGFTGIAPKANGYVVSLWRPDGTFNIDDAIMTAVGELGFGDILLLQSQAFAPFNSSVAWPVEIHEATFQVIRLATALGIVVIEPAGNGNLDNKTGNNLDDYTLQHRHVLCPASLHAKDSGAIVVAAASSTVPHNRVVYSNYGSRVNCFAWGENVSTAGASLGPSGFAINTYNNTFGGTSAASAIIAGAAIVLQSIAVKQGCPLNPLQLRAILSNELYGTTSCNGHFRDKIGVMPDLEKIIPYVLNMASSLCEHGPNDNRERQ
jgi:hypothetical protein